MSIFPFGDPSAQDLFSNTRPAADESRRVHQASNEELARTGIGMIPGVGAIASLAYPMIDDYRMSQFAANGLPRKEASGPYSEYSPSYGLTTQQKGRRKQDDYFPEMEGDDYNLALYFGPEYWEQKGDEARGKQNMPSYPSSWQLKDGGSALEQAYYHMLQNKRGNDAHYMLEGLLYGLGPVLSLL